MIEVTAVRHAYPEQAGFCIDRQNGYSGEYTFLHFHNSVEMIRDGKKLLTQPHAVILYEPGVPQYFKSNEPLIHDWMHFRADAATLAAITGLSLNRICYPATTAFITEMSAEIESEHFGNKSQRDRLLSLKAEELFIKVGRALTEQEGEPQSGAMLEKFRALRGQIFMSLDEKWTVQRMADSVFMSKSYFFSLYKSYFGISPLADLINARMNSAKNMLVFQEKSVEEIATRLGYLNTTHFIRQFKEYNGTTPAKYRKNTR